MHVEAFLGLDSHKIHFIVAHSLRPSHLHMTRPSHPQYFHFVQAAPVVRYALVHVLLSALQQQLSGMSAPKHSLVPIMRMTHGHMKEIEMQYFCTCAQN